MICCHTPPVYHLSSEAQKFFFWPYASISIIVNTIIRYICTGAIWDHSVNNYFSRGSEKLLHHCPQVSPSLIQSTSPSWAWRSWPMSFDRTMRRPCPCFRSATRSGRSHANVPEPPCTGCQHPQFASTILTFTLKRECRNNQAASSRLSNLSYLRCLCSVASLYAICVHTSTDLTISPCIYLLITSERKLVFKLIRLHHIIS